MMTSLIIGKGEVGKSLYKTLRKTYTNIKIKDVEYLKMKNVDFLHICYPYSKKFIKITKNYLKVYKPKYTIIHATVPFGTTKNLGKNIWHSPIRGVHPNLAKGIKTFIKYIGGRKNKHITNYFTNAGIKIQYTPYAKNTEAGKILSTTYYGWNIVFCKEIYKICKKYDLDFDFIYSTMNQSYNKGYLELNMPNVIRPVLKFRKGKIGGHCVVQNCDLLKSIIGDIIKKLNKSYEL